MPTFSDKYAERRWAQEQTVAIFRVFSRHGFADGFNGHVSLRDPVEPATFWINPYAKHFGKMCISDLVRVDENGTFIEGSKSAINIAGFVIHANIHRARPDINVICHAHSPYGRAWSCFGKPIEMLTQDACYFYDDLSVYTGLGSVILASNEGKALAAALGPKHKHLIMQNHGLITCGSNPAEAGAYFICLERACQTQLLAESAAANGCQKKLVSDEEAAFTKSWLGTPEVMYKWFQPEYEMILEETGGSFLR
ncbi:uncharacterized protein HMPREF1541_10280 [Cyphellophora europaea CBS 101466]|uniref:Class II aldolase/adducin N-terminal domain-containing protein n=1 Tax=Cyphellophora europaea (strain CBS 101466) TaxID=1220924 RepID=W2S7J8_CYPE1|nr:uncharacterized protein HMPREF1541_10280 [Cyphellophora europaea CBS 101466]ETN44610.1 hypothetical protein HMPREF1541_10280 [Cyphellophora europaea CBS 101466]